MLGVLYIPKFIFRAVSKQKLCCSENLIFDKFREFIAWSLAHWDIHRFPYEGNFQRISVGSRRLFADTERSLKLWTVTCTKRTPFFCVLCCFPFGRGGSWRCKAWRSAEPAGVSRLTRRSQLAVSLPLGITTDLGESMTWRRRTLGSLFFSPHSLFPAVLSLAFYCVFFVKSTPFVFFFL